MDPEIVADLGNCELQRRRHDWRVEYIAFSATRIYVECMQVGAGIEKVYTIP